MGNGVLPRQTHTNIQFFSFALIAIGMPSTKVLMSFGLVFAIANWVLEGGFSEKWNTVRSNRLLQLLIVFYLLLIIGLTWSWDAVQGLKDIKSRLPMLFLPLIMATGRTPMDVKQVHRLLQLFLATLFVTSLFNVLYFHFNVDTLSAGDIRGLSRFASHIRYGLLIALGFGICVWFQLQNKKIIPVYFLLAAWLAFYTIYSQVLSGTLALISVAFTIVFYLLYKWKKMLAFASLGLLVIMAGCILSYLLNPTHEKIDCNKLPKYTANGQLYNHNCTIFSEINGKAILAYYSEVELFLEWRKVSDMDFMGLDKKGELLRMTAARYMTAMGLTKDAEGIKQLTPKDIKNIEDGYSYPNERTDMIVPRIYGLKYQILNNQFPNGHSLLQRLEHWKAATFIIQHEWATGVGTGGNQQAFDWAYDQLNSPLNPENRLRSHNMYLAYAVSYGVLGILLFLVILGVAFHYAWKNKDLLSLIFLMVICGSFLIEDTLETQLGVTMFGFFMGLLMYANRISFRK